ncbi:helix-turn-helix domain-containing protein [Actinoplanes sp. NPDC049596]|uniref:ArsR/SmtB family transcription factor n=1 Tax=unclassified Actinoplanes TaxID=2626549 RepID=UPI00342A7118
MVDSLEVDGAPDRADLDLATVLGALADPIRLTYVRILARTPGEIRCGDVLKDTDITISKSTLSHHLKVLREAGLTHTRVIGVRRFITLRRDDLSARFPGLIEAVSVPAED